MQFFQKIFDAIVNANDFVNGIVWGFPLLVLILGVGIYFTVRLGFFQFTNPGYVFRNTVKKAFQKKDETKPAPGELTSFQDRKSTRLNSSHPTTSRMPSSA